jgi:hypothetical protein
MCGMIAARNHFRREPLSLNRRGRLRQWPHTTPRAGTFARAGKTCDSKRLGRRLADDAQAGAWGECGVVMCGRRPIHKLPMKKPAADFSARALTFVAMMALCQ